MQTRKTSPKAAYRLGIAERIEASPSLAEKFPRLKALTIHVEFFDPGGFTRNGGMKYKPNLDKAKAMVCFNCPCGECVGGDYDVTEELSRAVAARKTSFAGELQCQGMRHKPKQDPFRCLNLLRYEFRLVYLNGPLKRSK